MIYRIFGKSGYGKSEYIYGRIKEKIEKDPERRFDIFLIVPEQQTLVTERKVLECFGNIANLRVEVFSFDRMSNRVSRKTGGMTYDYADSALKKLVMNKTLRTLDPVLKFYAQVSSNMEFVEKLIETIDEMKLGLISPLLLEDAANKIKDKADNPEIVDKINEIGLIYAAYEKNFDVGRDISDEMMHLCSLLDTDYVDYTDNTDKSLKKRRFFHGTDVFIDSFDAFSNGQKAVLSRIIDQAENVFITFKCLPPGAGGEEGEAEDENSEEDNIFRKSSDTAEYIANLCKNKNIEPFDHILTQPKRFQNGILAYLEKNLWKNKINGSVSAFEFKNKLEVYECGRIFDEAEVSAKKVLYLTRELGYKYSDIQIVASDIASYRGILDSVFEKYGIPLFMSVRTQLSAKPLMSMLLSLFDMVIYDFRLHNIHSYIKNGLCGLTYKEIDEIEIYITAWQINGFRRYAGKDWVMHPDGYIEYDENDKQIRETLKNLNETRQKFIAPIKNFMQNIKKFGETGENTVKNITVALIDFLDEIGAYGKLYELFTEQKENGELSEAAETVQVWNILMELLQKITLVCGGEIIDLKRYSELFRFILNDIDIGKIPTSVDEVTAASAELLRAGDKKCAIILGLNADVFPAAPENGGLFADMEKAVLKEYGLDFSDDNMRKFYDQLYYFYNAVTSVSECVVLTYRKADINGEAVPPSMALEKVRGMYPALETYRQTDRSANTGDMFFDLEGRENGYIEMAITQNKILGDALKDYFLGKEAYSGKINAGISGFKESALTIGPELADILFHDINMSSTKLDSYVNCPFSYFCRYVLELRSESSPKMQMHDIGRFIHKILEIFMQTIRSCETEFKDIDDNFIKTESEKIIDGYLGSVIKDYEYKSERFKYLLQRLNKIIFEIIKNLRDEFKTCDFVPADFELGINDKNTENSVMPVEIAIPGKGSLKVTGIIDRVDIYKTKQNVYIRIVDYKTGSKKFNLSDVLAGINLQMFVYLFSVLYNGRGRYSGTRENAPAGVLYMPSKIPQYEKKPGMSETEVNEEKSKTFARSGLFLRDEKILSAMEHDLGGRYIPVKLKNGAGLAFKKSTASGVLASLEQIGKLGRYVSDSLENIAAELSGGKADVYPFKGRIDSCAFCDMRRVCRFEENDQNKKSAVSFSPDKVWDIIESAYP